MSKQTVKLVSGWSNPGGSTQHHIFLTNLLNDNGYDCTFYGPHDWHLDKCNGKHLKDASLNVHDICISHFIEVKFNKCKKHILSLHESNLYPIQFMDLSNIDCIQYVSNKQKKWHGVNHPNVIIPPHVDKFEWTAPNNKIAGVVGSVDGHKQTHLSVQNALRQGYKKVYLFGEITDMDYFKANLEKYIRTGEVEYLGHIDDKERLYGSVDAVFHHSIRETYGLVEAECKAAGVPFIGHHNDPEVISDEEILERWNKVLQSS